MGLKSSSSFKSKEEALGNKSGSFGGGLSGGGVFDWGPYDRAIVSEVLASGKFGKPRSLRGSTPMNARNLSFLDESWDLEACESIV